MSAELVKLRGEVLSSLIGGLEVSQFLSQVWMINDRVDGKYLWQDGDKLYEFSAIIDSQLSGYLGYPLSTVQPPINITQHGLGFKTTHLTVSQPASQLVIHSQPLDWTVGLLTTFYLWNISKGFL